MTIRRPAPAPAPEPQEPNDLLCSVEQLMAIAAAARRPAAAAAAARRGAADAIPAIWDDRTIAAAAALPVPIALPERFPVRGLNGGRPVFVAAPKDLGALDHAVCPERRNDPLLASIRAALLNDWHGQKLHSGASAAEGGTLPVPVLLAVLATQPAQQKARKWAQVLTGSGQTNVLAQVANVAARFVVCRPEGITLVRDFYAQAQ